MSVVLYGSERRVAALTVPAVVVALLVACSQLVGRDLIRTALPLRELLWSSS